MPFRNEQITVAESTPCERQFPVRVVTTVRVDMRNEQVQRARLRCAYPLRWDGLCRRNVSNLPSVARQLRGFSRYWMQSISPPGSRCKSRCHTLSKRCRQCRPWCWLPSCADETTSHLIAGQGRAFGVSALQVSHLCPAEALRRRIQALRSGSYSPDGVQTSFGYG